MYLYLRSHLPLYDQVYLYAKRIKKVGNINSPTRKNIISSPRVLSRFSPVASMIRRNSTSVKRTLTEEKKDSPYSSRVRKSTFNNSGDTPVGKKGEVSQFCDAAAVAEKSKFVCGHEAKTAAKNIEPTINREEDFTTAMGEDPAHDEGETHARKLPTLKVNSNDLNWLREQKASKDSALIQEEMPGDVVRLSTSPKKVSQFYIPPIEAKEDGSPNIDEIEESKDTAAGTPFGRIPLFVLYCECGNTCEPDHSLCGKCIEKQKPVEFSGHLYAQVYSGLKLCWFRLLNRELYCKSCGYKPWKIGYNSKEDVEYFKLLQLTGVFVREEPTEDLIDGNKAYSFSLHIQKNKKFFYARSPAKRDAWVQAIRKAVGYSSFFSFYTVKVTFCSIFPIQSQTKNRNQGLLGKGSFAEVRAAEHKLAKKNVAVKILKKTHMTEKQVERARSEIETLKLCQHPNIMRLYEVFENSDNIYLVLEYLSGGSLYSFMKERHFTITESMARRFVHSIAHALHYMHTYGIIHRDIKPDNIVLATPTEDTDVKIVDFGLAQILEPNELAVDPVGTLCYAAPEILVGNKYNKAVDMWSLGVLTFLLLVGRLPFDPELPEKEIAE